MRYWILSLAFLSSSLVALPRSRTTICVAELFRDGLRQTLQPGKREDLSRLDEELAQHLTEKSKSLSLAATRVLIGKLTGAQRKDSMNGFLTGSGLDPDNYGVVTATAWGLRLALQDAILDHPMGRLVTAHEGAHLVHGVSRWNIPVLSLKLPIRHMFLPNGVFREERWGFGSQWEYTRRVYSEADLPRLRELYPSAMSDDAWALLESAGYATKDENKRTLIISEPMMAAVKQSEPLQQAVASYMLASLNEAFIDYVRMAVTMTQQDFVESQMHSGYRATQKAMVVRRYLLLAGLGYVVGSAFGLW